jgi:hypothetical protein
MPIFNTYTLSEHGVDQGFTSGKFNDIGEDYDKDDDFNEMWWEEMCRFQDYMTGKLPKWSESFVPGGTPYYRSYLIQETCDPLPLEAICLESLDYLQKLDFRASIVIATPLRFPIASGSIILTNDGIWVEQDLLWWLYMKADASLIRFLGLDNTKAASEAVRLSESLPWTTELVAHYLNPEKFWDNIHQKHGVLPVGTTDKEEMRGYKIAREILNRIRQKYMTELDEGMAVSGSLGKNRTFKIECTREMCNRAFVEKIKDLTFGIDDTWVIRFMVFEQLCLDNSYLGALLIQRDGTYVIEEAKSSALAG